MPLPQTITHQDRLLTLKVNDADAVQHPVDGYTIQPLFLDPENGTWVLYAKFPPGTKLPQHFHTGTVHFLTTKGMWHYVEYPEDKQTAGSYLYEPGGSIHQFCVPEDATEAAEGFMVVSGANINFDEDGNFIDIMDAGAIEMALRAACQMAGREMPNFIKPGAESDFDQEIGKAPETAELVDA
ncbi:2,4'-dihydroxyacetophenone dioxygenase family protein [Thalassococcus sp. S3]|uniref:2,4'-dihydroxyacetophenone dioxygenase family protein n=1 Tax=Thalassococcus sp. S3 TaxID=2017482 RepID=UPI00102452C1|nr:2,4'-dihydroxyacetophenone dioxygenase family protein [Thalassococcus sp. S3]QBF34049.1 2,4'-dihydroxyacetophenone dioxygenase [Thalassococcus sp. S3]